MYHKNKKCMTVVQASTYPLTKGAEALIDTVPLLRFFLVERSRTPSRDINTAKVSKAGIIHMLNNI